MRIRVVYAAATFDVGDIADNIEALREIGALVSQNRSENLILELADGGTVILVVGPGIPIAVTYTDM